MVPPRRWLLVIKHTVVDNRQRRIAYLVIALILGILSVFPQPYLGRARILPRDPSSVLGAALGSARLPDLTSLLGGSGRSIDLYLAIAQSADIRNEVVTNLHLAGPDAPYATPAAASLHLQKVVDVQSMPGSILQIETRTRNADQALELTRAFADAISRHLREINNEQVNVKQGLLTNRFHEAAARLARAQSSLNEFRRVNRLSANPEAELGSAIALKSGIEARLQAKLVEQQTLSDILGPDNVRMRTTETEVQGLRQQLAQTTRPTETAGGPNAGGLTELSTEYLDRYRDYLFAQSVYEVYTKLSEQVAVESISGQDAPTVQFVETAHVEPGIHYNTWATAALLLLALVVLFTEFYAPATGIDLWRTRWMGNVS